MYYTDRHLIKRRVSSFGLVRFVPYRCYDLDFIGGFFDE